MQIKVWGIDMMDGLGTSLFGWYVPRIMELI